MKPFDLELAVKGHPLVLRNGTKVEEFKYFETSKSKYPCAIPLPDPTFCLFYFSKEGKYSAYKKSDYDLFLDDSVEWEEPLEMGDIVEVYKDDTWEERIFITEGVDQGARCVNLHDVKGFQDGKSFNTVYWKPNEWRRKPKKVEIDITVKVNGISVPLNTISDETLLKIKNN